MNKTLKSRSEWEILLIWPYLKKVTDRLMYDPNCTMNNDMGLWLFLEEVESSRL